MKPAILTVVIRGQVFLTNEDIGEFLWCKSVESIPAARAFFLKLHVGGNGHHKDIGYGKECRKRGKKFMAKNTERHEQ
jgi:hypothetical protein